MEPNVKSGLASENVHVRSHWMPGDFGQIVLAHAQIVGSECGFDESFERYVARGLLEFAEDPNRGNRFWLVVQDNLVKGSIFLHVRTPVLGQIRWFWLHPQLRGLGLGRRLLHLLVEESGHQDLAGLYLWTVSGLAASAHLYREAGFRITHTEPRNLWGRDVIEEKLELNFGVKEENEVE